MSQDRINKTVDQFDRESAKMIQRLEQINDEAAARSPETGAWNAAQIAWHMALSNDLFDGVMSGTMPMAAPAGADFQETFSFDSLPSKVKTFPQLEPPADAARQPAMAKLRDSVSRLSGTMRGLPADRWSYSVMLPFGTLSMYQFAEFAVAHVTRHLNQMDRAIQAT